MTRPRFTSDELNARVLQVINNLHPTQTNRLSREAISMAIYDHFDTSTDRKIRDAITELCIQGHSICATSDIQGYYLASTYQEAEQCIAELRSRSEVYNQKIDGIKRGLLKQPKPEMREAVQMGLQI